MIGWLGRGSCSQWALEGSRIIHVQYKSEKDCPGMRRRRAELILPKGRAPNKGSRTMYKSEKTVRAPSTRRRAELISPDLDTVPYSSKLPSQAGPSYENTDHGYDVTMTHGVMGVNVILRICGKTRDGSVMPLCYR